MSDNKIFKGNFTIPNIISVIRILLIPFFVYYFVNDQVIIAVVLIVISGLTDLVDGFIARTFNQISELGKMLDPLADKLNQIAIAVCFAVKFKALIPFMALFLAKEFAMLFMVGGLLRTKKKPCASKWYGKVATTLFYLSASVIVYMDIKGVAPEIFLTVSIILLSLTAIMMVYSSVGYYLIYRQIVKSDDQIKDFNKKNEINPK